MNRSIVFRIIMAFVLFAAILGLGYFAYQAGVSQGMTQAAQVGITQAGSTTVPLVIMPTHYYGMPFWGFFSCLIPLFLLFLVFAAFRALFGPHRHGWHRMQHGGWDKEEWSRHVPPMFDEWHRRAHEEKPAETTQP